jgi:hypothetical protein
MIVDTSTAMQLIRRDSYFIASSGWREIEGVKNMSFGQLSEIGQLEASDLHR